MNNKVKKIQKSLQAANYKFEGYTVNEAEIVIKANGKEIIFDLNSEEDKALLKKLEKAKDKAAVELLAEILANPIVNK